MPYSATHRRSAFTLIELLVTIAIIAILIAILIPSLGAARKYALQGKDATNIRAITQAMTVFAGQNDSNFPRPSALDLQNATVDTGDEPPVLKDNTGNILSVLVFNGFVEAEQLVSPAETNEFIEVDVGYMRDEPEAADAQDGLKSLALWDPGLAGFPGEEDGFSGVPDAGRRKDELNGAEEVGHNSYAIAFPFGDRAPQWTSNFSGTSVLAGNRGPQYRFRDSNDNWTLEDNRLGSGSNTLAFYGSETEWAGHIAYGDTRVEFSSTHSPEGLNSAILADDASGPRGFSDNVFVNESQTTDRPGDYDTTLDGRPGIGTNAFIRVWGNIDVQDGDVVLESVGVNGNQGNFID